MSMKKIEIEVDDSTFFGLNEMAQLLQITVGDLVTNCWPEGSFTDVHEDAIREAEKMQGMVAEQEEEWWAELRQERKLER